MSKKFVGVAYWSGSLPEDWVEKTFQTLSPVEGMMLSHAEAGGIGISYQSASINIMNTGGGKTQGLVPESPYAGVMVVALVALRRALGTLDIVDDAQASVPMTIRQSNPLYAGNWPVVSRVAESLGLVAGGQFLARHAAVMQRLF